VVILGLIPLVSLSNLKNHTISLDPGRAELHCTFILSGWLSKIWGSFCFGFSGAKKDSGALDTKNKEYSCIQF
jgi:hypothetical protein